MKSQDLEPKPKKPRKKTKPSALTRPPKKGKKKKNQRKVPQEQEVVQLSEDAADTGERPLTDTDLQMTPPVPKCGHCQSLLLHLP